MKNDSKRQNREPDRATTISLDRVMDRMVDGELSSDEQSNLLLRCEEEGRWRELALSYVESQVLGVELREPTFLRDEKVASSKVAPAGESTVQPRRVSKPSQDWNVMSLATAVLLSLGLGYGLGWWWQGDPAGAGANPRSVQLAKDNESSPPAQLVKNKVETVPYYVSDATNQKRQVTLPIVPVSDLGPNWQEQLQRTSLPEEMVQELRSKGMNVRHRRTMERVRLEDGRVMIVPIDYFYEELFP